MSLSLWSAYSYRPVKPPWTICCVALGGSAAQKLVALRIARNTRLVATGCLRTKSEFPASMQQKCCDHGRSLVVLTMTWPVLRACSSCGSGGKPRNESIFPLAKSSIGLSAETHHPSNLLDRIETDVRSHAADKDVRA